MRKKFIDKVYMREVTDKVFHVEENKEFGGYIGLKYVKDMTQNITYYCNGKKYIGLDKGYTILEYIPFNRNYNCRVFFDTQNRPICFYFDINNGVGIENGIPWYNDLYLDVVYETPVITESAYYIRLDDEIEYKQAKKDGLIDDETFKMGYEVVTKLMLELKEHKNDIVARCQFDLYRLKEKLGIK